MQPNTPKGSTDGAFNAAFSSHVHTYKAKISRKMMKAPARFLTQMQIPSCRLTPDQNATFTQTPHSAGVIILLNPHITTQCLHRTHPCQPSQCGHKTPGTISQATVSTTYSIRLCLTIFMILGAYTLTRLHSETFIPRWDYMIHRSQHHHTTLRKSDILVFCIPGLLPTAIAKLQPLYINGYEIIQSK